jgi:hypothetical protein
MENNLANINIQITTGSVVKLGVALTFPLIIYVLLMVATKKYR